MGYGHSECGYRCGVELLRVLDTREHWVVHRCVISGNQKFEESYETKQHRKTARRDIEGSNSFTVSLLHSTGSLHLHCTLLDMHPYQIHFQMKKIIRKKSYSISNCRSVNKWIYFHPLHCEPLHCGHQLIPSVQS